MSLTDWLILIVAFILIVEAFAYPVIWIAVVLVVLVWAVKQG